MTCVVGLETSEGVWLGADAFSGNDGWRGVCDPSTKIVQLAADLAVGIAGSWTLRQVLLTTELDRDPRKTDESHMLGFVSAWRERAQALGFACVEDGATMTPNHGNATMLVAYRGKLWSVGGNWAVVRMLGHCGEAFEGMGSGGSYAEGAMVATAGLLPAEERVRAALTAAAELSPTVSRPFFTLWQARP